MMDEFDREAIGIACALVAYVVGALVVVFGIIWLFYFSAPLAWLVVAAIFAACVYGARWGLKRDD